MPLRKDTNEDDWGGRVYGAPPEDDDPPRPTVLRGDPAVRLARYFNEQWVTKVLRRFPAWRGVVNTGDIGPMVGYLRSQMLNHLNYEHVEAMVDLFVAAVLADEIDFKDGQNSWRRFTGWWRHQEVEDPAIERKHQEEVNEIHRRLASAPAHRFLDIPED